MRREEKRGLTRLLPLGYGANPRANCRCAAYYADRILKGDKPGDLPVEQPREFELAVDLKMARRLGITIP